MIIKRGKYDFHIHSTFSDGCFSVEELIVLLQKYGCKAFSITDHDNIKANKVAISYLKQNNIDIKYVTGIEFSCIDETTHIKSHILGYNFDYENKEMLEIIEDMQERRRKKMYMLFEHLDKNFNIKITQEDQDFIMMKKESVGKPRLVEVLIRNGYLDKIEQDLGRKLEINEIYRNYLKLDASQRILSNIITEKAIKAIINAGGIPVYAHPTIEKRDNPDLDIEEHIKRLISYGLKGIEIYNECIPENDRQEFKTYAQKYNLITTGGTDYHGESVKEEVHILSGIDNNCVYGQNDITLIDFLKVEER